MALFRRIQVAQISGSAGTVSRVSFSDRRIVDEMAIREMGDELLGLVEQKAAKSLLLNFNTVDYLGSACLNCLIVLDRRLKSAGGKMRLCGLNPAVQDVFAATRLTKLFEIKGDESEALQGF